MSNTYSLSRLIPKKNDWHKKTEEGAFPSSEIINQPCSLARAASSRSMVSSFPR